MDVRRRVFHGFLLVAIGAAAWIFVVRPFLPASPALRRQQVQEDAIPLTQLLRYDLRIDDLGPVENAWAKRRPLYDAEMRTWLAETLTAFVDFEVAEYAEARAIYTTGRLPNEVSDAARETQARLAEQFGDEAQTMIRQFRERVREPAYATSPKVAGGVDPDAPRWDQVHDDLVTKWLPAARARIEELTGQKR